MTPHDLARSKFLSDDCVFHWPLCLTTTATTAAESAAAAAAAEAAKADIHESPFNSRAIEDDCYTGRRKNISKEPMRICDENFK